MVANELYASLEDINAHLESHKAAIEDAEDDVLQVDVFRFIRSKLVGTFATTILSLWTDPDSTPELVRAIAGRLIAAKWYMQIYTEDDPEPSTYSQFLYDEALSMLQQIIDGGLIVIDPVTEEPYPGVTSGLLGEADFWPSDDAPKFTMGMEFA